MASNPRILVVRQTHSTLGAANLQIEYVLDDAAKPSDPFIVEPERDEEHDCPGCTRPNNAEVYMVRCVKCELYFHIFCTNTATATAYEPPFVCRTCLPLQPRSTRSSGSRVSSNRSARIAMELQHIEELYRIQEAIEKEKLVQLERQRLYSSKKYALLQQMEEEDEIRSVRSSDSRASSSRTEKWIVSQTETRKPSPGQEMIESDDHIQPLSEAKANDLRVKHTPTSLTSPNASSKAMSNIFISLPPDTPKVNGEREVEKQKDLKLNLEGLKEEVKNTEKELEDLHAKKQQLQEELGQRKGDDEVKEQSTDRPSSNNKMYPVCDNSGHFATNCTKFSKLEIDNSWKLVKQKKICHRCLVFQSRWPSGVQDCQKKHHQLLRYKRSSAVAKPTSSLLIRRLPVTMYGMNGKVNSLGLLDDGSSVTPWERKFVASPGLKESQISLYIDWPSEIQKKFSETQEGKREISGVERAQWIVASNPYTVDKFRLPEQSMEVAGAWVVAYLQDLQARALEILIFPNNIFLNRKVGPISNKTQLGWTVYGSIPAATQSFAHRQFHISDESADIDLHESANSFFAVENHGSIADQSEESVDDQRVARLSKTSRRGEGGDRFKTGDSGQHVEFPDSRSMAEKRIKGLVRRPGRAPALYDQVLDQTMDFQTNGFENMTTDIELDVINPHRTWYLPLGVEINPKKSGKFCVVWDASAKVDSVSCVSNTMMLKRPNLLTPLLFVRFQVKIRKTDRSVQELLWRYPLDKPLETLVTEVAIFSVKCSPAHLQYVKNLNATDHETDHPKTETATRNKYYVNVYLKSVDTVDDCAGCAAVAIVLEVAEVHKKARSHIRNWISNDKFVLESIAAANPTTVRNIEIEKENRFKRLLGMVWLPDEVISSFTLNLRNDNMKVVPAKTRLLSNVINIYNPNGLVVVCFIHGNNLFQDVWKIGVACKDLILKKLAGRWKQWIVLLRHTKTVIIWSASKAVLQWIKSTDLHRFRLYVPFLINEILSLWKAAEWRNCLMRMNTADEVTKWVKKDQFLTQMRKEWATEELRPAHSGPDAFEFNHVMVKLITLELFLSGPGQDWTQCCKSLLLLSDPRSSPGARRGRFARTRAIMAEYFGWIYRRQRCCEKEHSSRWFGWIFLVTLRILRPIIMRHVGEDVTNTPCRLQRSRRTYPSYHRAKTIPQKRYREDVSR